MKNKLQHMTLAEFVNESGDKSRIVEGGIDEVRGFRIGDPIVFNFNARTGYVIGFGVNGWGKEFISIGPKLTGNTINHIVWIAADNSTIKTPAASSQVASKLAELYKKLPSLQKSKGLIFNKLPMKFSRSSVFYSLQTKKSNDKSAIDAAKNLAESLKVKNVTTDWAESEKGVYNVTVTPK